MSIKNWWWVNEELLYTLKLVLSAMLSNAYLGIKIKSGIENIYTLYGLNFIYIETQCNMQYVTLNLLTYISEIIDSFTYNILTE